MGTFYYFATDLSRYEEGNTEMGGILKRLVVENDVARTELIGPPNPIVRQQVEAIRAQGPDAPRCRPGGSLSCRAQRGRARCR